MMVFTFCVLHGKQLCWGNLVQNIKIVSSKTYPNMQNSMVVFTLSVLCGKQRFWTYLVQNIKIFNLSGNLVHRLINKLNMQNSMVVFTFSVLDQKHSFCRNLVQNLNIDSLSGNLVLTLHNLERKHCFGQKKSKLSVSAKVCCQHWLEYREFSGGLHFSCFRHETPFLGKFGPKNRNCHFQLKLSSKTYWNMESSMVVFTFSVLHRKYSFWAIFGQRFNNVSLIGNLVPTLIQICRIQ